MFIRSFLIVTLFSLQSCSNTLIGEKLENSFDITENTKTSEKTNNKPRKLIEKTKIKSTIKDQKKETENDFGNIIKEIFKDDTSTIQIDRFLSDGTEIINGFRTNKWTTIISTKNNKLVIDEWVVDQLLLKDSLYSYLLPMITDDEFEDFTIEKVSSRDFIRQVDSTYSLEASNESIVLAKLLVDSENSWIQSASFEIRELYAVPFDASSFAIPEEYERIQIDEDSDEDAQEKEID